MCQNSCRTLQNKVSYEDNRRTTIWLIQEELRKQQYE